MIVGLGLIARELYAQGASRATYHAAGVSNSRCTDPEEFARDEQLLRESLTHDITATYRLAQWCGEIAAS